MTTRKLFAINMKGNSKTAIPTTTSHKGTCPDNCKLKKNGCYADYSFLGNYWKKLSNGEVKNALTFVGLLDEIRELPDGQLWRHNQAGDLITTSDNKTISAAALKQLIKANEGKHGFTYTHHTVERVRNRQAIRYANQSGFTINLSSNNLNQADWYLALGIAPVCTLLEMDAPNVSYTPAGNKVVACPAEKSEKITCKTCKLCAIADRDYIIGFRAHGSGKKKVELIASDKGSI